MGYKSTHCKRGHEFTEENTYTAPKTGYRTCRTCMKTPNVNYGAMYRDRYLFGGNREKAIQRDGERCVACGFTRAEHRAQFNRDITVDHIVGTGVWDKGSEKPNNSLDNLQTLCQRCHGIKDSQRSSKQNLTVNQVANIKHLRGSMYWKDIADSYGCDINTVGFIMMGKIWTDVK